MKHTPGPWIATDNRLDDDTINVHTWNGESGVLIAILNQKIVGEHVALANARLIAAAPELLRNLKAMVRWADPLECGEVYEEAQALIIKLTS